MPESQSRRSRVFSPGIQTSAATMRDLVNNSVLELGYRPNALARGLRSQRSMSVGFAVADLANPIFADIVRGAERELRASGYSLLLTNSEGDPELDADNIELLEDRRVDGMLLSLTQEDNAEVIRALRASALPMVLLDRDRPEGVNALLARFDHRLGMTAAVRHLLELGHRDFAMVIGGPAFRHVTGVPLWRRRCGRAVVVARSSRERSGSRVAIGGPCGRSTARRDRRP